MTKENDITSIRIPKSVKLELGKVALDKESYHITIQRLIKENHQLNKSNERSDELIEIYKGINNGFDKVSAFAKRVCEEYLMDSNCPTLFSYKEINKIISSENTIEDKLIRLKKALNSDGDDGDAFMCALDYYALYSSKDDIKLFNAFLTQMYENNPYDKMDMNTHYEWIKWNDRFNRQYQFKWLFKIA